jgi:hypothetical protein
MALPAETGIADLPDGTSRAVIAELDARVRRGAADAELRWMLAWYCREGQHVFELYGGSVKLLAFAHAVTPDAWRTAGITPARMAGRGQLGMYWSALAAGAP